jgi:hypothetical protein
MDAAHRTNSSLVTNPGGIAFSLSDISFMCNHGYMDEINKQIELAAKDLRAKLAAIISQNPKAFGTISVKFTLQNGKLVVVETTNSETVKI